MAKDPAIGQRSIRTASERGVGLICGASVSS
jgi:hypothetical protein